MQTQGYSSARATKGVNHSVNLVIKFNYDESFIKVLGNNKDEDGFTTMRKISCVWTKLYFIGIIAKAELRVNDDEEFPATGVGKWLRRRNTALYRDHTNKVWLKFSGIINYHEGQNETDIHRNLCIFISHYPV